MRLLHTADWHLGKGLGRFSRLEEQAQVLEEICLIAEKNSVDAVLIAGDQFDAFNPSAEAGNLFYRTVKRLSANGNRPVIVIAGNHDAPERVEEPEPLAKELGIFFAGYPDTQIPECTLDTGIAITKSAPGFLQLQLPGYSYPLRILLTPYANELRLKKYLGRDEKGTALRHLLQNKWRELAGDHCKSQGVNVMIAHLLFMQENGPQPVEPEEERPILFGGWAQTLYPVNVPPQMQYVALGHQHDGYQVDSHPCPIVYCGSPLAYSFAEAGRQKSVIIVDLEPGQPATIYHEPLYSGKPLCRGSFENVEEAVQWLQGRPGALVELTLCTENFLSAQEKQRLLEAHPGIVHLIPAGTGGFEGDTPERLPDLSQSIEELFIQYFKSRREGQSPNEDIIHLFREIQNVNLSE